MKVTSSLAKSILQAEISPLRFEKFCIDLYAEFTGIELLPTSRSWDLGRDGRRSQREQDKEYFLCVSTDDKWESKVKSDVEKLKSGIGLVQEKIYVIIALNCKISEFTCEGVKAKVAKLFPEVEHTEVLYLSQLAKLSEKHPEIFINHYCAELEDVKAVLEQSALDTIDAELMSLRIALSTELHEDATVLRSDLMRHLILSSLQSGQKLNSSKIALQVSSLLHLGRSVGPTMLQAELQRLLQLEYVNTDDNEMFYSTEKGKAALNERNEKGAERLLQGRKIFKEAITLLSGSEPSTNEFDLIWKRIEEAIANLFHVKGLHISRVLEAFTGDKTIPTYEGDVRGIIKSLADDIARSLSPHHSPDMIGDFRQSIIDIFYGEDSHAFEWLSSLCVVYISLLSLGLEPSSCMMVQKQLGKMTLLLDTDVVLNFLCEGEKQHNVTKLVLNKWLDIGGALMCPKTVLAEATHHAYNANYEYDRVWSYLGEYTDETAIRELDNAFVRAFRKLAEGKYSQRNWSRYIRNFQGKSEDDPEPIASILKDELKCESFTEERYDKEFAEAMSDYIFKLRKPENEISLNPKAIGRLRDKSERDGILLASVAGSRSQSKEGDKALVVISSSTALEKTAANFTRTLGDPFPVLTWAGITYLMSLVPEAKLHLGAIRGSLFDVSIRRKIMPLEQFALSVIRRSQAEGFAFSRRVHLKNLMQRQLGAVARQEGRNHSETKKLIRDVFEKPKEHPDIAIQVISGAVSELTLPREQIELSKAKEKIRQMAMEITTLRSQSKGTGGKLNKRSVYKDHQMHGPKKKKK